jgi:hypothetical protein
MLHFYMTAPGVPSIGGRCTNFGLPLPTLLFTITEAKELIEAQCNHPQPAGQERREYE